MSKPTVKYNPKTGGATITFPKGYLGDCMCGEREAKHTVWCEFSEPIPAIPKAGLPEVKGIWHNVCNDCLKPDDIIKAD